MKAIEFTATLQDGTINIPLPYYEQWNGKRIRVLLLEDSELSHAPSDRSTAIENPSQDQPALLTQLQQIKITAPADFSENIDQYLNGEKNA